MLFFLKRFLSWYRFICPMCPKSLDVNLAHRLCLFLKFYLSPELEIDLVPELKQV